VLREPGKRLDSKNLTATLNHGSEYLMIWACFSYQGVSRLEFIEGIMDSAKCTEILSRNLIGSAREMGLGDFILQQDNDPKHTLALTKSI
jgi:hypothetical protein